MFSYGILQRQNEDVEIGDTKMASNIVVFASHSGNKKYLDSKLVEFK